MQNPPTNPNDMIQTSHQLENSGSDFFIIAVLVVIFIFFVYTVIIPKIDKSKNNKNK